MTHFTGKLKKHLPIFALFQKACCEVQAGAPGEKRCDSKKKMKKKIFTLEHSFYYKKRILSIRFFLREKKNFEVGPFWKETKLSKEAQTKKTTFNPKP